MPFSIQIDDELYARVAAAAADEGKDVEAYIAEIVRGALCRPFAAALSADTEDLEENYAQPGGIRPVPRALLSRAGALVKDVEVDLDAPLPEDDSGARLVSRKGSVSTDIDLRTEDDRTDG